MEYTHYVCLKVLFRVQFEGVTKGLQLLDEQHILFKADSVTNAREQLTHYAEYVGKPYLNSDKKWVRWQLDQVLDAYGSDLPGHSDFGEVGGMEVFSTFRQRRRRPADYWAGPSSEVE